MTPFFRQLCLKKHIRNCGVFLNMISSWNSKQPVFMVVSIGWIRTFTYDMGVFKNDGTPKWVVYNGKPYEQMGDLGGKPIFLGNPHILLPCYLQLVWGDVEEIQFWYLKSPNKPILWSEHRETWRFFRGQLVLTQVMRLDDDSDEEHSPYAGFKGRCAVSFLIYTPRIN